MAVKTECVCVFRVIQKIKGCLFETQCHVDNTVARDVAL